MQFNLKDFIGRNEELAQLIDTVDLIKSGKGCMIFITGNPGTGKTTLLEKFISEIDYNNKILIWDIYLNKQTSPLDSFSVFRNLFEKIFLEEKRKRSKKELANELMNITTILLDLVPLVGPALGRAVSLLHSEFAKRFREQKEAEELFGPNESKRFASFLELLDKVLKKVGPAVLIIEDIQWIDISSINMLWKLSEKIESLPLLILCTYRPAELKERTHARAIVFDHIMACCDSASIWVKKIKLNSFSKAHVKEQLVSIFSDTDLDYHFVDEIYNRTRGNPLFVSQLVKLIKDKGLITKRGGVYKCMRGIDWNDLPKELHETILSRIGNIYHHHESHWRIPAYGSVLGESFTVGPLKRLLSEQDLPYLNEALDHAVRTYYLLIYESDPSGEINSFSFLHSLVYHSFQEYMKKNLELTYKDLHKKVAYQLEDELPDDADVAYFVKLAKHFEECNIATKALKYYQKAGILSRKNKVYYELASIYEHIIRLINFSNMETPQLKQRMYFQLGKTYATLGQNDKSIKNFLKATDLAERLQDDLVKGRTLAFLSISYFHAGKFDESQKTLNASIDIYKNADPFLTYKDILAYGTALNWKGIGLRNQFNMKEALKYHKMALEKAKQAQDNRLEAHARANIGAVYFWERDLKKAISEWENALQLSNKISDHPWIAHYTIDVGMAFLLSGEYGKAYNYLSIGISKAKKGFFEDNIARGLMNMGTLKFLCNQLQEAENCYLDALDIARGANVARLLWRIEHNLGNVYSRKGGNENLKTAEQYYLKAVQRIDNLSKEYYDDNQKLGFIRHRLNPFRMLIKHYVEVNKIGLASSLARRGTDESLFGYLERRIQSIDLLKEEKDANNFNFKDGYYVETE